MKRGVVVFTALAAAALAGLAPGLRIPGEAYNRGDQETPTSEVSPTSVVTATETVPATPTLEATAVASDTATPTLTPRYAYVHLDIKDARIAVCDGLEPSPGTAQAPPLTGCVDIRPRSDITPAAAEGEQYLLFASDRVRYRVYRTAPGWCEPVVIIVTATPGPTNTSTATSTLTSTSTPSATATLEPTPTPIPPPDPSYLPLSLLRRPTTRPR